jgi:hypothetical protein
MPLLNYTTTVAADRTASEIIRLLTTKGATQVLTDYRDGAPVGLAFVLPTPAGMQRYRLPVDTGAVEKVMNRHDSGVPNRYRTRLQAERVAWRILKDWVAAQLAIIETQMVTVDQVFLPYMLIGDQTVYEGFLSHQLALEPE